MKIKYVKKEKLHPYFGAVVFKNENIYIRKDLPKLVQRFLIEHEKFHLKDYKRLKKKGKKDLIFWAEIKANVYGFIKQPLGAILTLIMSLSFSRLKLYLFTYKKELKKSDKKLK